MLHFLYAFFSHVSEDLCLCYLIFNMNVSGGGGEIDVREDVSMCERETVSSPSDAPISPHEKPI